MGLTNELMKDRIPDEGPHYEHHIHYFWSSKASTCESPKRTQSVGVSIRGESD